MVTLRLRAPVRANASAICVALTLGACSDAPRCKPIERCDVRTRSCQRAAREEAICLRDRAEFGELEVSVVTLDREAYLEQVRQEEESAAAQQVRRGLALFELAAPPEERKEARVARARQVAGFYESSERRITIVGGGTAWDTSGFILTLVHEFVHALQDAAGQLDPFPIHGFDQMLVRGALVEGEATILTDEAAAEGHGFSFRELDYTRALSSYRGSALAWVADSASLFDTAYSGHAYAFGASYLWPLRRDGDAEAIGEAFRDPPVSTYAIMHGDPVRPAQLANDLEGSAAPVLTDFTRLGCYRFGRFFYEARRRAGALELPESGDFVADTLCVFADAEEGITATWRIRFASDTAATWAAEASLASEGTSEFVARDGLDVWWAAGFRATLPGDLAWEAAPARDFGFEDQDEPEAGRIDCLRHAIDDEPLR
jgi:hypothetical protein